VGYGDWEGVMVCVKYGYAAKNHVERYRDFVKILQKV
jgi:hypothetical protein